MNMSWLLFGAKSLLNSGESEYWPSRSFPCCPFCLQFLSSSKQLTIIPFQDFVPEIYFSIKWAHLSIPLSFKSRHDFKWHFNQINVFLFFKKKICQFVFHFLCPSVTITPIPLASGLPLSTIFSLCFHPLHLLPSTMLLSPSQLTWLSAYSLWFSTTFSQKHNFLLKIL